MDSDTGSHATGRAGARRRSHGAVLIAGTLLVACVELPRGVDTNPVKRLGLSAAEQTDLVQYLLSL